MTCFIFTLSPVSTDCGTISSSSSERKPAKHDGTRESVSTAVVSRRRRATAPPGQQRQQCRPTIISKNILIFSSSAKGKSGYLPARAQRPKRCRVTALALFQNKLKRRYLPAAVLATGLPVWPPHYTMSHDEQPETTSCGWEQNDKIIISRLSHCRFYRTIAGLSTVGCGRIPL